jgi:hypothetical protein
MMIRGATMQWGHAPSPLRGWGDPHPLAGDEAMRRSDA